MAQAKPKRIKCAGYTLKVTNDPDDGRSLDLVLHDDKGKEFEFRVKDEDDHAGLVMQMFETLTVWPGRGFFITVEDDEITEFSRT